MLFRSSRWFERQKHDSRLAKFCNIKLESLFLEPSLQYIIALNSFTLALKTAFQAENVDVIALRRQFLVSDFNMFSRSNCF